MSEPIVRIWHVSNDSGEWEALIPSKKSGPELIQWVKDNFNQEVRIHGFVDEFEHTIYFDLLPIDRPCVRGR